MGMQRPTKNHFIRLLKDHFGDRMYFSRTGSSKCVLTFTGKVDKLLVRHLKLMQNSNTEDRRLQVVKAAAIILREDIRKQIYRNDVYPPPNNFLEDAEDNIPSSLLTFFNYLTMDPNKSKFRKSDAPSHDTSAMSLDESADGLTDDSDGEEITDPNFAERIDNDESSQCDDRLKRKVTSICHSIISLVRPRSFISPVLLGLSISLHQNFGSEMLIDLISSMGFGATYKEVRLFEASCLSRKECTSMKTITYSPGRFVQFASDNADHNTRTTNGKGTFHVLGNIAVIVPKSNVPSLRCIPRLSTVPAAAEVEIENKVPIIPFQPEMNRSMKDIPIQDVLNLRNSAASLGTTTSIDEYIPESEYIMSKEEVLWSLGVFLRIENHPPWAGFMEKHTRHRAYEVSQTLFMQFIDLPATSVDALNTSMVVARENAEILKQGTTCITFDQPLHWKARKIIASTDPSQFESVVVKLGNFHLLMAYLGAIGHIMKCSGIEELFGTVYAGNFIKEMMTGKSYARAIRGHFLAQTALLLMILKESELTDLEKEAAERILSSDVDSTLEGMVSNHIIADITIKLKSTMDKLEKRGKTSKLWIQYVRMISLVRSLLHADRSTNWNLHLSTIKSIMPFFYSGGRHQYLKSAHLYLQDMLNLKTKMKINSEKLYNSELNRLQVENNNYSELCEAAEEEIKNYYNDYLGRKVVDLYHDNLTDLKTRYQESSMEFKEEKEKLQSRFGDSLDKLCDELCAEEILKLQKHYKNLSDSNKEAQDKLIDRYGDNFLQEYFNCIKNFTIRRSEKFWCGLSLDLNTEQTLMRVGKDVGKGFTHGRGVTPSVLSTWIHSLPFTVPICQCIEDFTGTHSIHSEQHKDLNEGNIKRFYKDSKLFSNWLEKHPPFLELAQVINIGTGIVGGPDVNCFDAQRIGEESYNQMLLNSTSFDNLAVSRSKVITIATNKTNFVVNGKKIQIDPMMLYERMIRLSPSEEQLNTFFQFELCPFPLTLFEDFETMRVPKISFF